MNHIAEFRYCWICTGEFPNPWPRTGDVLQVDCATCGRYDITGSLYASAFPISDSERYRMSYWTMRRQLERRDPPRLTTQSVQVITADLPDPPTHEKAGILLLSLTRLHSTPGEVFKLDTGRLYSLACARDGDETEFFLAGLSARTYLDVRGTHRPLSYTITHAGWEQAAKLAVEPNASRIGFVALHFTDTMLALFRQAFAPAITRAGFEPHLANFPTHNEQIDARIVREIKQSRFVVADVTGARTGVYFEAGYALGHGRPVIWTCRQDAERDMHFDTRQYNHILWKDGDHLQELLYDRIVATI